MIRLALALLMLMILPARGEQVVAGLSQNRVSITATFVGSEILIFGAVKRDAPAPVGEPLEVVVVVEGPSHPVTVRRKAKRWGIWVNTDAVLVDSAPSFYAVATSNTLANSISEIDDLRHHISIPQAIRLVGEAQEGLNPRDFAEAVVRIRGDAGLYKVEENAVKLAQDTLFDTRILLPANLTEGEYRTRIYLTRGGYVASQYETIINVQKVGLERWIFNLAHERPLVYGILSLVIAIAAGWGASAAFRLILRT
ncbi:TIGR02186 family protein [Aliiroseovarius subalbicans]|uniref:TIGR02186 family protein n=1 Tax=Aliiroseovarius subalbicans TaxID=2925840 RepID=UPI001F5AD211|nr:TIGR02186 family protein [Aliiroseovarius subalbicans]